MQNFVVVCIILHTTKLGFVVHVVADQTPLPLDRLRDFRFYAVWGSVFCFMPNQRVRGAMLHLDVDSTTS